MEYYAANDFTSIEKYDTHVHLNVNETSLINQSEEDNFKLITINVDVASEFPIIEEQQQVAIQLSEAFPGIVNYACTFSVKNFNDDNWIDETIASLKASLLNGAIAV